jgi:hypothetical protein
VRALSAAELLSVWECGRDRPLPERALDLIATAATADDPRPRTIGERDALLIDLRERTFGPALATVVTCESCGELLEVELDAGELREHGRGGDDGPLEVSSGEERVRFRLPEPDDLVAAAAAPDAERGRAILLERCVLARHLTPALEHAIGERMAQADPGAWIDLALVCPACGAGWTAPFDIVAFLWTEVETCARRLVRDVHALASAYGWRESDVLALSPARRASYLELVAG